MDNNNVKLMELKDTISLMQSENYKERFKAEYYQVKIRLEKLKAFIESWENIKNKPVTPKMIYVAQIKAMEDYLYSLIARAAIEEIEL